MSNEFQSFLEEELRKKFLDRNIVVWFDRGGVFSSLVGSLNLGVEKLVFDGSFLKLRFKIYEEDPDLNKKWLVYVPLGEEECEWLADVTVFSGKYSDDFEMIFKKLGYEITSDVKEMIKKSAKDIIENPEKFSLKKSKGDKKFELLRKLVAPLFDESIYDVRSVVLKFVNKFSKDKSFSERLESKSEEFVNLVCEDLGEKNVKASNLKELRDNLIKCLFFSEFYSKKKDKDNFRFKDLLPEEGKIPIFVQIVENWQRDVEYRLNFIEESERLEKLYDNLIVDLDIDDVVDVSCFKCIDDAIFKKVNEMFDKDSVEIGKIIESSEWLFEIINKRENIFWASLDKSNHWVLLEKSLRVILSANDALESLSPTATKDDLVSSYISSYWMIDQNYRDFAFLISNNIHKMEDIQFLVEKYYAKFLEKINRAFSESQQNLVSWAEKDVDLQSRFWEEVIKPLEPDESVAVIVVDALRYELAKELERTLEGFNVNIKPFLSLVPSTTEVGMTAILPHEKISFEEGKDKMNIKLDGELIKDKNDRKKIIKNKLNNVHFFEVSELVKPEMSTEDIKKSLKKKNKLFIFSKELDLIGHAEEAGIQLFSQILSNLQSVILKLNLAGVKKFVVITDHGFLFTRELKEENKIELPEGKIIQKSRRFVIGKDLEIRSAIKIIPSKENVESELELAFPPGIACFRTMGGTRFHHGGTALQEIIIPCMMIAGTKVSKQQLKIKVEYPEKIANSLFKIRIQPVFDTIQDIKKRTLEIKTFKNDVEVAETVYCEMSTNPEDVMIQLNPKITEGEVKVKIMDFNTKETLSEKTIPLDFMYGDVDF